MALGMRPESTFRRPTGPMARPTGPSNLAASMFGGLSAQQPVMPQLGAQLASPQPTVAGRIPIGGAPANLSALFAEADKMAKESQSSVKGGTLSGKTFQPDQATQDLYADFKKYNSLYQYGNPWGLTMSQGDRGTPLGVGKEADARRKQMDLMSLGGMSQSEILKAMGYTAVGDPNAQSAQSTAAMKEAEAFLKSLGL